MNKFTRDIIKKYIYLIEGDSKSESIFEFVMKFVWDRSCIFSNFDSRIIILVHRSCYANIIQTTCVDTLRKLTILIS